MPHGLAEHNGVVSSGQTLSGVTLAPNYGLTVQNGGTLLDAIVTSNGDQVAVYGVATGTTLANASLFVESGGSMTDTTIGMYGRVEVFAGGIASDGTITAGYEFDYGLDTGTTITAAGVMYVQGGVASEVTVTQGGLLSVDSGGLVADSNLRLGAEVQLSAGGLVMSGDVVGSGAVVAVLPEASQATATATVFASGATLLDVGGATLAGATISAGAHVVAANVVLFTTSNQIVSAGNHLDGTKLVTGYEIVYGGGFATNTVVEKDTRQVVSSGGTASATMVFGSGYFGGQDVAGLAISTIVEGGGEQNVNGSAAGGIAVARNTLVESGGLQSVESGTSVSATLLAGGVAVIVAGGVASGTIVDGGAVQYLSGNAHASATHILAGGVQIVSGNSVASGSLIAAGGEQELVGRGEAGPQASGTIISASGTELIKGGAIAMSSIVMSGGLQNDQAGTASGTVVDSGGDLRIGSAAGAADITVKLGGKLDYATVKFASGATASVNSRNVLMVHDGGTTLVLQLVGSYAGEQFEVSADGTGGTYVILSAAAAAQAAVVSSGEMLSQTTEVAPLTTLPPAAALPALNPSHAQPGPEPLLPPLGPIYWM